LKYGLSTPLNVFAGATKDVCVKCENAHQTISQQVKVVQDHQCKDALSKTSADTVVLPPLAYADSIDQTKLFADTKSVISYFTAAKNQCPITSCKIKDSKIDGTCETDESTTVLVGDDNVPTTMLNTLEGKDHKFCMQCTNDLDTVSVSMQFKQKSKCAISLTALVDAEGEDVGAPHLKLPLVEDETVGLFASLNRTLALNVVNSDSDNCPITTCNLLKPGCFFKYNGLNLK